ncbi:schwannomin-interacting protein 1 [Thalassophryne amazonica]|uniref:schwannomin-interacting protein 1 n=1 Tax=Thalassophryne amazonica TaxID=390379 RepID=UPI0014709716|nr:schwannomin-interacting protein 1 [Thalassophryne amazonica]
MDREKETAEENDDKEVELHHHFAAAAPPVDYQELPIMHWEDLSLRIAELEKQEQERREKAKRAAGARLEESRSDCWEEDEDFSRCHVAIVTSRFHMNRNLQLCFINDSESEEEAEPSEKKLDVRRRTAGLKEEVVTALRLLRDKVLEEQKEKEHVSGSSCVSKRKHLERWDLQECSVQQLSSLKASLQQDVYALSSELVTHLVVRDQLRTKQDAMLLDVQDLT